MAAITSLADSAARLDSSRARLASSNETFLALLTTQLKNQDPLSPLDSNQFTQQIVQMTGVEQQLLTNDLLQSLVADSQGGVGDAVSLIGKTVVAESPASRLADGKAEWLYELPANANTVSLEVLDTDGKVVWRGEAPSKEDGRHAFSWDGRMNGGGKAPDGLYGLRVTALNSDLQPIATRTFVQGEVTGVENDAGETLLYLGKTEVPMTSVVSVKPKAETADETQSLASSLASKAKSIVTSPIAAAARTFASAASLVL